MTPPLHAKPFLKWAGGKTKLLPHLLPRVPRELGTYAEPFLGGGALFFALANERALGLRTFKRAILSDTNEELVATYRAVQRYPEALIEDLARMPNDAACFYRVRAQATDGWDDLRRAARFIFLNRTCFNGLYRVNRAGTFNVPYGRYARPRICDPEGIREASRALEGVEIRCSGYRRAVSRLVVGDFAYFDPPYVPLSGTANFTAYAKAGFGLHHQAELADALRELGDCGVCAMLSNADTTVTRKLYRGLAMKKIQAARSISCDGATRRRVGELVVTVGIAPKPARRKSGSPRGISAPA